MKALALLMFLLGVMAMLFVNTSDNARQAHQERAAALNFVIFRNAVHAYVFADSGRGDGDITVTDLDMPEGWHALRSWKARLINGRCTVWGDASAGEIAEVVRLLQGSYAVGTVQKGALVPGHGGVTIPLTGIPDGSLVSVVAVQRG